MKKTTLLLLFIWVLLNQTAANAYSQGITLSFKSAPLSTIFKEIEKQTSFDFIYPADELYARKVTITVTNAKLEEVMDLCLQGLPFTYSVNEKRIVVKKVGEKAPGVGSTEKIEPIELTGRVVDENGKPVAGATVTVRGTSISTATEADGTFVIKGVDAKATIAITNVGFETQIISLKGKTDLSIKLVVTAQQMKEVVISTGYQKISSEKFVGSYSQLDSAAYHRRAGMGIIERLDGTVTGVLLNKKNGIANPIQIRGVSSLGAGSAYSSLLDPLIVVDNFPMDPSFSLENVNPNDVDNITVLKDAAATSIWGARAGNGVIVITTKRGKYNRAIQINVSSNVTIENKPDLYYIPRISSSDFIDIEKELFEKGFYEEKIEDIYTWPVISPVVEILLKKRNNELSDKEATEQINALRNIDIRSDLNEHIYKPSVKQQHYLNISGGSNVLSYLLSFGYNSNTPNVKGSGVSNQFTLNTGLGFKPTKNLEIQTSINYGQTRSRSIPFDFPPEFPYLKLVDESGNPQAIPYQIRTRYIDTVSNAGLLDWKYRPLDEIKLANQLANSRFVNLNINAAYKLNSWLGVNLSYQYLSQAGAIKVIKSPKSFFVRDQINRFYNPTPNLTPNLAYPFPVGGLLSVSNSESEKSYGRVVFNINHAFGIHQINSIIGSEISELKGYNSFNQYYGYDERNGSFRTDVDFFNYYPQIYGAYEGASARILNDNNYYNQPVNRFVSAYANVSYTYNDKYTIYSSIRRDGANLFGVRTNNKWKPLWSVAAKWQISKENFFSVNWIEQLSIRASFGYSGNVNNTSSGKLTMIYAQRPSLQTGLTYGYPAAANNPDLRWEKVGTFNMGVDFSFCRSRISGSVDVFRKNSIDVIADYPFDPSTGVAQYPINSASLSGSGMEINVNSINLKGKFQWSSNLRFSYAKTIVDKIYKGGYKADDFISFDLNPSEGKLAYAMSSYKWGGLDPLTGDPQGYFQGKVSKEYFNIFNDSIQNQIYHGSSIPLYSLGIGNSFRFGNFTISFLITGRFDFYSRKPAVNIQHNGVFGGNNYLSDFYDRWKKPGDENTTNIPSIFYPVSSNLAERNTFFQYSQINVYRADNIRLQDLRLQYDWMNKRNSRNPIRNMQLFFYPNNLNLIIWRANSFPFDPDFGGTSSDPTAAPPPKTWTFGVNFSL